MRWVRLALAALVLSACGNHETQPHKLGATYGNSPVVTTTTTGSTAGHFDMPINPEIDGDYEISAEVLLPSSGTIFYFIAPNATSFGANFQGLTAGAASGGTESVSLSTNVWLYGGVTPGAGSFMLIKGRLYGHTGRRRMFVGSVTRFLGAGVWGYFDIALTCLDTTTPWTSLRFASNTASDFSGSEVATAYQSGSIFSILPLNVNE